MGYKQILDIRKLSIGFDGFQVLDNLNFSMDQGEIRFLIGPNGAGKTTLLDVITGKVTHYTGKIEFNGIYDLHRPAEYRWVRRGMARKFQTPSIFPLLTVYQNIEVAAGFRSRYRDLLMKPTESESAWVKEVLEKVGLNKRAHIIANTLSHGEKQWLEIGMLLIQHPRLLLLDEPVAGMSRVERDRTGELLKEINQDCSILVIEHDMVFVRKFASIITVMHQGQVICEGDIEKVQADPRVREVYLGHNVA